MFCAYKWMIFLGESALQPIRVPLLKVLNVKLISHFLSLWLAHFHVVSLTLFLSELACTHRSFSHPRKGQSEEQNWFCWKLKVGCSETRWIDNLFNIWPFATMKICRIICQNRFKILTSNKKPSKCCQRLAKLAKFAKFGHTVRIEK